MNPTCRQLKAEFQRNDRVCAQALTLFHLIANKARFRIVCLLARGELSVNEIAKVVDAGKLSNISQQLKMLALAGVVEKRRKAQRILYRLRDPKVRRLVGYLQHQFLEQRP